MKTVGLEDCRNKLVRDFLQGTTQRLKLEMALPENPDILILDEPVNGLDPDGIAELQELLLHLNQANLPFVTFCQHGQRNAIHQER
ncbi:ATP-binding cassette domain-containing protein [Pelotomaculum terephthalicicum]|uniref:ATP-binding cassette domain-containing protein n=1 Tax=Pelotomaculum terephthalicicum TaxID=206393 RepID=UPI0035E3CA35